MTGDADAGRPGSGTAVLLRTSVGAGLERAAVRWRLRRRCQARLVEWEPALAALLDVRDWAELIAARRGRPVLLRPARMAGGPCGLWVPSETGDYVFYEQSTSPLHQTHIIFHELCHMICGHPPAPVEEGGLSRRLFPSLDLDLARVRAVLPRAGYSNDEEFEAELQASVFVEAIEHLVCRRRPTEEAAAMPGEDGGGTDAAAGGGWLGVLAGPGQPSSGKRLSVASLRSWTSRWRAHRRLYPLWRAVHEAGLVRSLEPAGGRLADALTVGDLRLRLYRRVIEIRDGLLAARDSVGPVLADAARSLGVEARLDRQDVRVLVETAVLTARIQAGAGPQPRRAPTVTPAIHRGRAHLDAEVALLADITDCYRGRHPRCSPLLARL